ncbi:MFS transporter [Neosynechococcus sphagnicola]|uniref:MFS transporter n=1 Tax=Neosynechococcus sphagnicola TaxID=1501145 RepID=UPI001EF9D449|nr:MFS transporter [Neosynechococcus sphagnicola]
MSPQLRRNLLVLFAAGLFFWSSLASLLPTLPLYVQAIGGSNHDIGLVMGSFAIGLLLSRRWLGQMADRRGRKIVMLIGMAAVAIAPLGYLLIQFIPLLMVVRAFHGLSIAAFAMAYAALVTDLAPDEHRGEIIGYMSLVNPVGVAFGPAMGGFLQEWLGYTPLFILSSGLGLLGWICTMQIQEPRIAAIESTLPPHPSTQSPEADQFWSLLLSPRLRIPTLVMLLIGLAFGVLSTFVPLYIKESQVALNPGLFYAAAAIASFGVRVLTGQASDHYGRGLFITMSLGFYTLAMSILSLATEAEMFLLAGVMEGMGSGILIPMVVALMSDRSFPHERGRVFSLCMGGFDLGLIIAGPALGFFAEQIGYRGLFQLAAGLSLLAVVTFLTQSSKDIPRSLRFAVGRDEDAYAIKASE